MRQNLVTRHQTTSKSQQPATESSLLNTISRFPNHSRMQSSAIDGDGDTDFRKGESYLATLENESQMSRQLNLALKSGSKPTKQSVPSAVPAGIPSNTSQPPCPTTQTNQSKPKPASLSKIHKYYIDLDELNKLLTKALSFLKQDTFEKFQSDEQLISSVKALTGGVCMMHLRDRIYQIEDSSVLNLVYFECFKQQFQQAIKDMQLQLNKYITSKLNGTIKGARLGFSSEKEMFNICVKLFSTLSVSQRHLLSYLWQTILIYRTAGDPTKQPQLGSGTETPLCYTQHPTQKLIAHLLVKIGLRCRGRTISRSNHLQRAVFENNLSLISRLLSTQQAGIFYIEKNELDARDNSALTLAVKLQNLDAIKILTDAYCSAKLSAAPQLPSAYELACSIQHEAILQILIASALKLKQYFMDLHKEQIFKTLEQLPDFSIDLHFECASSYIPFLNYVSPSDTYKIYKKGTNLRLDMTLIGFRKLQSVRGNLTVIYKGRGSSNEGELLLIDHDRKSVNSIFADTVNNKIDAKLENILKDEDVLKKYQPEHFKIEKECDASGRPTEKRFDQAFMAQKYTVQTVYTMTKYKQNLLGLRSIIKQLKAFTTFDDYLANDIDFDQQMFDEPELGQVQGLSHRQLKTSAQVEMELASRHLHTMNQPDDVSQTPLLIKGQKRKTVQAVVWASEQHPLSIGTFLPLLNVLSFSSKQVRKLCKYLQMFQLPSETFPISARVPLFMTMEATFNFRNLKFSAPAQQLFEIDDVVEQERRLLLQKRVTFGGTMSMETEEEQRKRSITLQLLYKNLSKTEEDQPIQTNQHSSNSSQSKLDQLYEQMLCTNSGQASPKAQHEPLPETAQKNINGPIQINSQRQIQSNQKSEYIQNKNLREFTTSSAAKPKEDSDAQKQRFLQTLILQQPQKSLNAKSSIDNLDDILEQAQVAFKKQNSLIPVQTMQDINQRHELLLGEPQLHLSRPPQKTASKGAREGISNQEKRVRRKEMIRQYKMRKTQPIQAESKDEDIQDSMVHEMPRPQVNLTIEKKALINNSYITRVTQKPGAKPSSSAVVVKPGKVSHTHQSTKNMTLAGGGFLNTISKQPLQQSSSQTQQGKSVLSQFQQMLAKEPVKASQHTFLGNQSLEAQLSHRGLPHAERARPKYMGYQRDTPQPKQSHSVHPKTRDVDILMSFK